MGATEVNITLAGVKMSIAMMKLIMARMKLIIGMMKLIIGMMKLMMAGMKLRQNWTAFHLGGFNHSACLAWRHGDAAEGCLGRGREVEGTFEVPSGSTV